MLNPQEVEAEVAKRMNEHFKNYRDNIRIEVIDHRYDAPEFGRLIPSDISWQDGGNTLKLFLRDEVPEKDPSDELVAVAIAIYRADTTGGIRGQGVPRPWDNLPKWMQKEYLRKAKFAIKAYLEVKDK